MEEWGVKLTDVQLRLDNQAALTIAENGSNWRTRYFGVRGARINEEVHRGRLTLGHEPTKTMLADSLTKLGTADMLRTLRSAMRGELPDALSHLQSSLRPEGPASSSTRFCLGPEGPAPDSGKSINVLLPSSPHTLTTEPQIAAMASSTPRVCVRVCVRRPPSPTRWEAALVPGLPPRPRGGAPP